MCDQQLTLNADECGCLVDILQSTLKNMLVEEHRTRAPSYRQGIIEREKLIEQVLRKLGQPVA